MKKIKKPKKWTWVEWAKEFRKNTNVRVITMVDLYNAFCANEEYVEWIEKYGTDDRVSLSKMEYDILIKHREQLRSIMNKGNDRV